jgi:hypothetical protein
MKKVVFGLTLLIIVISSCTKKYRFYGFDVKETILQDIPIDVFIIDSVYTFDLKIDDVLHAHDTELGLVDKIIIEEVLVDGVGYNKFSELKFYISNDTLQWVVLARNDTVDYIYNEVTGDYTVSLNETEALMDTYVKESKINIRVIGELPTPLHLPSSATITIRFRVFAYVK